MNAPAWTITVDWDRTDREIGAEVGLSHAAVWNWRKRLGITKRKTDAEWRKAMHLRIACMLYFELVDTDLGRGKETMNKELLRHLKKAGVTIQDLMPQEP